MFFKRILGIIFLLIVVATIAICVMGIRLGHQAVDNSTTQLKSSLTTTAASLDTVQDTLSLTRNPVVQVNESLVTAEISARDVATAISDTRPLLADVQTLTGQDVPDSLESVEQSIPDMRFDSEGIHHAILNIVTNAIDACGAGDNIVVDTSYSAEQGLLRVTIQDSGEGIEPENLTKIFSVFESGKGNRGTGLGLSVSQKIIQEHGGEIRVDSQVGQGSCFTIEFPAILADFVTEKLDLEG